jgi:hypothetical protein
MNILYCRVGWMSAYRGMRNDSLTSGGAYNKDNTGFEVYNYQGYHGCYYGFVEPGIGNSIHIERLGTDKKAKSIDDMLAVWIARKPSGGQRIIGWYRNAIVYRNRTPVPDDVLAERRLKDHNLYNIYSESVTLLPVNERTFAVEGIGQSNIWYGNQDINKQVLQYVDAYDQHDDERIVAIEKDTETLEGKERESVIKTRVNQDIFRKELIEKYKRCNLCGVDNPDVLIASHIKPWAKSDKFEKLDSNNGFLLCPNHDKLFDEGYISFSDTGKLLISEELTEKNRIFMNVSDKMKIEVNDENAAYLKYHREHVFRKN